MKLKSYLTISLILLAVIIGINRAKAANYLSNGLVAYWTLDGATINWKTGQVQDVSGIGNTANVINMSTTTSPKPGKIRQALNFNGTNGSVNALTWNNSSMSTFTISLWAKRRTIGSNVALYGSGGGTTNKAGMLVFDNGEFLATNDAGTSIDTWLGIWLDKNSFHHIVLVQNSLTSRVLYFDDINEGQPTTNTGSNMTGFRIGEFVSATGRPFPGVIDDVRVYNRALTSAEIYNLYREGLSKRNNI